MQKCNTFLVDRNGPFCYNNGMVKELNEFEVMLVVEDLRKHGIVNYTMRPGNNCIWVSYGLVNSYYIFNNGKLVDIQVD